MWKYLNDLLRFLWWIFVLFGSSFAVQIMNISRVKRWKGPLRMGRYKFGAFEVCIFCWEHWLLNLHKQVPLKILTDTINNLNGFWSVLFSFMTQPLRTCLMLFNLTCIWSQNMKIPEIYFQVSGRVGGKIEFLRTGRSCELRQRGSTNTELWCCHLRTNLPHLGFPN